MEQMIRNAVWRVKTFMVKGTAVITIDEQALNRLVTKAASNRGKKSKAGLSGSGWWTWRKNW